MTYERVMIEWVSIKQQLWNFHRQKSQLLEKYLYNWEFIHWDLILLISQTIGREKYRWCRAVSCFKVLQDLKNHDAWLTISMKTICLSNLTLSTINIVIVVSVYAKFLGSLSNFLRFSVLHITSLVVRARVKCNYY